MFYIEKDDKIVIFNENKQTIINTIEDLPEYRDLEIKETNRPIIDYEFADTEEYKEKQAKKERERLDSLYMTRSDFFDGMIMAFSLDSKELRVIVENVLNTINITPVQIRVALNNYDNALNFYRKHTLFELINNVQIPISETMYLLFTDEIWDKFFDTKDYKELQKAIHEVEPEVIDDKQD